MSGGRGPKLTYANVMSSVAVFLVLGGGAAFAASRLGKHTVGTKQLKNNAVTTAKIKNNAVNGAKVANGSLGAADLDPSVLGGYAKTSALGSYAKNSDLSGYLKGSDQIPGGDLTGTYASPQLRNGSVGPDKLGALPAAALEGAIYNVNGEDLDCRGATNSKLPDSTADDIDFETVAFDNAALARQPTSANPNCFDGFLASRAGTYLITAWIGWEANGVGDREITLAADNPGGACCGLSASNEQAANDSGPSNVTAQTVSGIARLQPNAFVSIQGRQTSGGELGFFGGGIQIAWLGP